MKKVYKIIFKQEDISKETMRDPTEKEKQLLAEHEKEFRKLELNEDELMTFYKVFKIIW